MKHHRALTAFLLAFLLFPLIPAGAVDTETAIVCPTDAPALQRFAAREARRYVYQCTGALLPIVPELTAGDRIQLTVDEDLDPQAYALRTSDEGGVRALGLHGGSGAALLYAVYHFAEHLGARFYLHGDSLPDPQRPFALPKLDEIHAPLFNLRGIQPFHDFPEGPDWWNPEDYKAIIAQLPKLRMNFIGFHTYPENRPNAEPTVWIGLPEDVNPDGSAGFAYSAIYYNTALPVGWGFQARDTGAYACGAGALYDRNDYGSEIMRGLTPRPDTPEEHLEVFRRAGALFKDAFTLARTLGVRTCMGTETPLVTPRLVYQRLPKNHLTGLVPEGGRIATFTTDFANTDDDPLYQAVRFDLAAYRCRVPNGAYEVTLRFCEPAYTRAGARVFGVRIENEPVLSGLDVFARAGANTALDYTCENVTVDDGVLDVEFVKEVEFPCIAAIAVTGEQGAWKVNCGGGAYEDYAADAGSALVPVEQRQELYRGIFTRIQRTHPLDYYWLWTPETWTWQDVPRHEVERTIGDLEAAYAALDETGASFRLATCGWVLGPQYDRAHLDNVLPKDVAMSCINRQVGHDPVEPGFANVEGRPQWAIPWLEDDPAMTSIQLWAGRMRRDAQDALAYGCTGLMGIHWRTRILAPNVAALAKAAWDQSGWPEPEAAEPGEPPRHLPAQDFYTDWAAHEFGLEAGVEAAAILARIDGDLPRPSDWVGGPGGYKPDATPWEEVKASYGFVDEFAALRPKVKGKANLERFDYWLNNFAFLRATGRMRCDWHAFNTAFEAAGKAATPEKKARRARDHALPARIQLVKTVTNAYEHLLATVTTTGAMGTVTNLEQHTFPGMLHEPAEKLEALLGEPLPDDAFLPKRYTGPPRLVVTTRRGAIEEEEALPLKAVVLDHAPPQRAAVHWRPLGMGPFQQLPMRVTARNTCRATLPATDIGARDIEYYVEAETENGTTLRWPAAAPRMNQAVVCLEKD